MVGSIVDKKEERPSLLHLIQIFGLGRVDWGIIELIFPEIETAVMVERISTLLINAETKLAWHDLPIIFIFREDREKAWLNIGRIFIKGSKSFWNRIYSLLLTRFNSIFIELLTKAIVWFICSLENNNVNKFLLKLQLFCSFFVDWSLSQAHWKISADWQTSSFVLMKKGLISLCLEPIPQTKSKQKIKKKIEIQQPLAHESILWICRKYLMTLEGPLKKFMLLHKWFDPIMTCCFCDLFYDDLLNSPS